MKRLPFLFALLIGSLSAQQDWFQDSFHNRNPVFNDARVNPSAPPIYPTINGSTPQVAFALGAWYFIDGNAVDIKLFESPVPGSRNANNNSFLDGSFHDLTPSNLNTPILWTQSVDGDSGATPDFARLLVAGNDTLLAITNTNGSQINSSRPANFTNPSNSFGEVSSVGSVRAATYSPQLDTWFACSAKITKRTTSSTWSDALPNAGLGDAWQSITSGPEGVVAVSSTGKYAFSSDGSNWSTGTINSSINFKEVQWGGDYYVAVGGDRVYASPDGTNWSSRYLFSGANFQSVAYGNNTWVAIPQNGTRIHYSNNKDASSWNSHTNVPNPVPLRKIIYAQNLFVAVGPNGQIRWSPAHIHITAPSSHSQTGGTFNAAVTTDWSDINWSASSPDEWITFSQKNGIGQDTTVPYTLTANTGHDRTGCILVNSRSALIKQDGALGPEIITAIPSAHPVDGAMLITWPELVGETGFTLQRRLSTDSTWTTLASLPANTQHFMDTTTDPTAGVEYSYNLISNYSSGSTSTSIAVTTESTNKVTAIPLSSSQVVIAWSDIHSGAPNQYSLTRGGINLLTSYTDNSYIDTLPNNLNDGSAVLIYDVCHGNFGTPGSGCFDSIQIQTPPLSFASGFSEPLSASVNKVSWLPNYAGNRQFEYDLYRASSPSSSYSFLARVDAPSYFDLNAPTDARYRWQSRDTSSGLTGELIDICSLRPSRAINLTPNFNLTNGTLFMTFSDDNATSWEIQQQTGSGAWFTLQTEDFDSTTDAYNISNLTAGDEYTFRVRTLWRDRQSEWFESTPQRTDLETPLKPFIATNNSGQLFINWPDLNGADSYDIQRSLTGTSGWSTIATDLTSSNYTDTGLTPQTTYHYRVRGRHTWDTSDYSESASATVALDLSLIVNYHDLRRFQFSPPNNYTQAVLERINGTAADSSFENSSITETDTYLPNPGRDTFLVNDSSIAANATIYKYRVRFDISGTRPVYTEIQAVYPPIAPPTNLSATAGNVLGLDAIILSFTPPSNMETYDVLRRPVTNPASNFEFIAIDRTLLPFNDFQVVPGVSYEYRVRVRGTFPFFNLSKPSNTANTSLDNTVAAWRLFHFGTSANSGDAANSADPDGGGLDNLGELLFDLDPNDPSDDQVLFISQDETDPFFNIVSFLPRADYQSWPVSFQLLSGTDLSTFPTDHTSHLTTNPTTDFQEYKLDTRNTSKSFFRLEFSEN